jgi:hypothetical protein
MIDENINEDLEAQDLSQDVLAVDAANQVLVDDEKPRKKRKSRWAHVTEEENVGRLDYKYEDIVDFEKQLKNLREQLKSGAVKYESLSEKEKEGLKTLEQNLKLKEVKVTPKKSDSKEYITNLLTGGLIKQQKKISDDGYFGDKDFWENIAYASGGQIGVPETYKPVRKSALGLPDVPLTDREISLMRDPQTGTDASGKERTLRVGEIFYDEASNTYQKWQLKDVKDDAEYMPTEFIGVPLEDAKTVAKLNKENGTQASISTSGQIYASENGKQYVVENGFWKVKNPGDAYYYFITDPKSIKNVNSYFGQNLPVPDKTKSSELIRLNNIDRDFVNDVYKTFSNDDEISDWAGLKTDEGILGTFDDKSSRYETQSKIKSFLEKYGSDYNIIIKADNPYLDQMTGGFTDRFGMTERSITIQTKRGTKRFYIDDDNLIPDIQNFLIANAKPSYTGEAPVKKETKTDKELSWLDPEKLEKEARIVQPKEGFKVSSPDVYNFDQAIISDNTKVYNYFNEINRIEKEKLVAEEKIYGPNAKFLSAEAKEKILLEKNKPILDKERQQLLQIVGNKNLQAATEYITAPNFTPSSYSKDVANALKAENNSIKKKLEDFKKNQSLFAEKQDLITQMGKDAADIKNLALQYKNLISERKISVEDAEKILIQKQAEFNERYSFVNEKYLQDLQNEQSKLIKDADELSNSASAIELISSNAEYAAGIAMMKSKDQGSFMGGLFKSIFGGIADIPGFVFGVLGDIEDVGTGAKGKASAGKTARDAFSDLTEFFVGAGTSEEYEADANLLYKATTGLARSVVQSSVGGNFALFGGGYNEMATQLDKTDMTAAEKILASSIYGTVSMALEKYGLDEIFGKGGMGSSISRYIMKRTVQGLTKDMSKEAVEALVTNEIKLFIADKGIKIAAAGFAEGFTESLQTGAEYGTKATIEAIRGETMFKDAAGNDAVTWRNLGKDAFESFKVGALGGHTVTMISQSASVVSRGMNALDTKEEREALVAAARAAGMEELVVANLQASLLSGKYSKETAQSILENFKIIKQKVNTIPKEMPIREQAVALDLILERDALNSQIEGVDPALAAPSIERVKEINETLKQIGYAVQESSTESVLQRQQEGTGETRGGREGVEPVVQGKEATEKSSQEKVDVSEGISDQSKTSESYSEDVVQVREPRKSGYKNTIVKKTETTDEKGRKEVKYERYAVDENGNERKMSGEGIGTTVGEFAPLTNENNLFYDDDGNLTYDANAEVNINSVTEYKDENGNTKYSTKLSVRAKGKGPFDTRIITDVNPVNEETYRTESISKFQGTVSDEITKTSEEGATAKEGIVPGATAKVADVDIVYPTEPQAEERKAFRSTSEYVENASKELPVEDVETLTKELDGDFGLLTAENPMAQPLTEEENKQLNQKAEEWLTERGYKPRRVTGKYGQAENSFFVPNLTRQDAIEFAKQFNQEAVAHSDGLVYQDGSMNPRVKADDNLSFTESYSPESDFVSVVNTKDGLKTFSIGYDFGQKVMPEKQAAPTQVAQEVTITPETNQTITERINNETDAKKKKVFIAVQKVLSAIPNARIILHENTDSFVDGVAKSANTTKEDAKNQGADTFRGAYVNGDVHINLETAGVTTVFHEAFHDLLAKKGMDNNALLDMAKGLKSVISDKALKQRLDEFISNYEEGDRAEEYTAELGAIMAEAQKELSTTKFQQFKTLINKIAKKLGLPVVFSAAATAQDAVDFMNSMAGKLGKGENILTDGFQTNIVSDKIKSQKPVKVNKDQKLTFVKQSDIIDIKSLINEIASKNQNVLFWVGDQLGRGLYFDNVINGEHYLDAGPSYALDPENRSKGIIWASGANPTTISNNIEKSDYIFIVSGSPQSSKLFNKSVANIVKSRIENKVDFNEFKNNILNSKPTKPIIDIINKYNSYDELFNGSDRKSFIIAINEQQSKGTQLKKLLESYDAFVDPNELRDGFYKDNNFQMGDVMLVLKPEKIGDKSKHSTYETDIIGSVVGVPDMVINSYDLMPEEIKNKYKENLERAQQQQVVAPYGMGVKQISKIKAQRTAPGNKLFNEPLKDAETIAKSYMNSVGMDYIPVEKITKLDENLSKRISDAYDKMKNDPNDPKVKAAYEAMAKETLDQYKAIIDKGYKVEINNTEPYSDSGAMIEDLRDNKRMKIFSTESGFGDEPITDEQRKENPLLRDSGFKDVNGETLLVNDVFRFVHDFFGHAKLGNGFGPIGEENAWRVHSEMYSPEARKAMTSETRGQNSWVNFSGVNDAVFKKRDKARQLRKEGKIEEANQMVGEVYEEMSFADQKVGLLPDFAFEEGRPSKIKAQKQSKEDAIQDAKDIHEKSFKRFKDDKRAIANAVNNLEKSKWYRDADDTQRENAVIEIKKFFGEKLKAAPSVAKITGKTKDTAVVSDLAAAIRDQIKLEAKAAREATKDINQRRKELGIAIKNVIKNYKGKISEKQLSAINDRISKVNLLNEETVDRVIDYVDKVMKDADYKEKINKAKSARATIKKLKKDSNRQAEVRAMATAFASIDPDLVEDIDEYMAIAEQVKNALKPTSLSISNTTKFSDIYSYVDQYLEGQENIKKERLLSNNPSLVEQGIIDKSMSLKDIESKIRRINEQKNKLNKATNSEELKDNLKGEINSLKDILKAMVFGYNPVTDERVEMTDRIKQVIKEISSLDVDDMTTEQMIALVESLNNFVKNGTIGGLDAAHKTYVGIKNANDLKRKGFVARQLKAYFSPMLGRLLGFEGMSLNELFTRLFGGVTRGNEFMEKSGVAGVVMGVNKAKKMSNAYQELYANTFKNIKGFFDQENVYERGVLAFVYRTNSIKPEEANKEFNRRIDLLLESYESLKNGTAEEQKMAEVYKKVFDRLNIESRDMSVIESNAKQFNIAGAAWWMGTWENHYQDLYDVSLSIYNTDLGSDFYYTSDRLSKLSESTGESIDITNISERGSSFLINTENEEITDKSKAGVLIASTYPKTLKDKGRYVNLNFDINQSQALSGAIVDIETAGAIRQVDAFISSDSFKSIIPNSSDRSLVVNRINKYIRRSKNKLLVPKDYARVIDKVINEAGRFGTTMALGGVFQFILQTFSVGINTLFQAGKHTQLYTGKSFNDWMNSTGTPTANRGVESVTSIENKMNAIDPVKSTLQQVARQYQKLTQVYMRTFLSKPDVFVARAAWKSYYLKYLSDNGYDTKKINWDTWNDTIKEEGIQDLHKKAMLFAENMVSRQQNVSDERLAGETFASEDGLRKAIRKILLPFAGFSVNQRMRLANDIITLTSARNVASKEDIEIAGRSLAGTIAEQTTFNFIKFQVGKLMYYGAMSILGYGDDDEDEEEAKKRNINALKYPIKSFIGDMASPAPFLDDFMVWAIDKGIKPFMEPSESEINDAVNEENNIRNIALGKYEMTEDEKEEFIKKYKEDNTFSLESFKNDTGKYGLISVGSDAYEALYESLKMNDGKYTEEFQGKETEKYLTKDQIGAQKIFSALKLFHFIGALPREANQLADKGTRKIKQNSLTKNQYESYKEFKKVFKREPKPYELDIIKSTPYVIKEGYTEGSNQKMLENIYNIDQLGGLSNQQGKVYAKLMSTGIEVTPQVYKLIQKGKTVEQIRKFIISN